MLPNSAEQVAIKDQARCCIALTAALLSAVLTARIAQRPKGPHDGAPVLPNRSLAGHAHGTQRSFR
jgi:hypothetical protein